MKHDFYQSILFKNGSSAKCTELESQTLPYAVTANGHRLRNYKIYGADGGVGDYDSETDKYIIPVTVAGKNVLQNTRVGRSTAINSIINDNGSVTFSGTASARVDFYIAGAYGSTNNILSQQDNYICSCVTDTAVPNGVQFLVGYNTTTYAVTAVNSEYSLTTAQISYFAIRIPAGTTLDNVTFYPMICSAGFSNHDFEPYYNKTTNIILDEPLAEDDYIDFREQQRFNADSSSEIISLPALYTVDGTNIISVDTTVQPDKIYVQGNIQEIVLSQVQTLNSVSFDRNFQLDEIDKELALDAMPIGGVEDGA